MLPGNDSLQHHRWVSPCWCLPPPLPLKKKAEFKTEPSSVYIEIPSKDNDREKDKKENEATPSVVKIDFNSYFLGM